MASRVGKNPLRKSRIRHARPYGLPTILKTLVAPIFPEPCSRMFTPFALAIKRPNGMEPARKAMRGGNQSGMLVITDNELPEMVTLSGKLENPMAILFEGMFY